MRLLYNRRQLTRKRSKAVGCGKEQMYKKNKGTAKINLPLGQAWLLLPILFDITAGTLNIAKEFRKQKQRRLHIFSYEPRVGSDILANYKTAYSVYLLCSLFIFYLFFLFIYLLYIYLIHLYIYLFIFVHLFIISRRLPSALRHPPPAVHIRRPFPRLTDTLSMQSQVLSAFQSNIVTGRIGLKFKGFLFSWWPWIQTCIYKDNKKTGKKAIGLDWQNNDFASASRIFSCRHCTTAKQNCLASPFQEDAEDVNAIQPFFDLFFFKLRYSPLADIDKLEDMEL